MTADTTRLKISMKRWVVYGHYDAKGLFYIGVGEPSRAFSSSSRTNLWRRFVAKNKDAFEVEILAWFSSKKEAADFEKAEIARFKPPANIIHVGPTVPCRINKTTRQEKQADFLLFLKQFNPTFTNPA